MPSKPFARADVDGNTETSTQEPGENNEVVVPTDAFDNDSPTYESCYQEEGRNDQGGGGDGEDGGASIGNVGRRKDQIGHYGQQGSNLA